MNNNQQKETNMNKRKFISMLAALAALPGTLITACRRQLPMVKNPAALYADNVKPYSCPLGQVKPGEKCFSYSGSDVPQCHLFQPHITPNPEEWCAKNMVGLEYTGYNERHEQMQMRITACRFINARVHIHAAPVV